MASEPPVCPGCGSPVAAGQETCIECGTRLGGRSLPAGWLVPALAALAVAATAAAVVLAIGRNDGGRSIVAPPLTATSTAAATRSGTATGASTAAPATTTAPPATTTVATSTAAIPTTVQRGLVTWPAGAAGFTVVVASLPRAVGLAKAQARAREVARRGLPQAGVLVSDGFASLHPGYLVVFSGVYATLAAARRGAAAAQGVYPGAYPRRIAR